MVPQPINIPHSCAVDLPYVAQRRQHLGSTHPSDTLLWLGDTPWLLAALLCLQPPYLGQQALGKECLGAAHDLLQHKQIC